MTAAIPLRAPDGKLVAVLAARLHLSQIDTIVQRRTGQRQTEDSFLVNAGQFLVTQPRFIDEPVILHRKLDTEAVRRCAAGNSGVVLAPDYRGIHSIIVYRWNAKYQLGLIVKIYETEALASSRTFARSVVLISSLALLATAGLALLLARSITRPLLILNDRVRRFAKDDIQGRSLDYSGDEVSLLAREFDQMVARVAERSIELSRSNEALRLENAERSRAEDSLRESQQLIEGIINSIPVRVFWKDRNLAYLGCNAAFARDAGCADPKDIIGKDDFQMAWREQAEMYRADDREVIESGCLKSLFEELQTTPDGKTIVLLSTKTPLRSSTGQITGVLGTYMDISERKIAESVIAERTRLTALAADVGFALTHGLSSDKMLQGCADAHVKHLDAAFARIWTLNAQTNVLELRASAGMYTHIDGRRCRISVGDFKIGLIAQERKPHLTNQVLGDPRVVDQEWAKREGIVSFAGYPLTVDDRVVGVVALFARHPLPGFTLDAMAGIADGIALGIERMRQRRVSSP